MADPRLEAVSVALEKAHNAAKFGSMAARSGSIDDRTVYVSAVLSRAQAASRSWANWEAINRLLDPESEAQAAASWLELTAVPQIRKAMARDAIMTAYSLSDSPERDRRTLCQIAQWLERPEIAQRLVSREWAQELGYSSQRAAAAADENKQHLAFIKTQVFPDWRGLDQQTELGRLRALLRPTRNHLAHAIDPDISEPVTVDQMRRFISLTLKLATSSALLWIGSAAAADRFEEFVREEADRFWSKAFAEPIRMWRAGPEGQAAD